jgi:hypothetical protein
MSTQTILGHSFPTPCKRCGGALYRQVDYCPYCGAVHPLDGDPHKRVGIPGSRASAVSKTTQENSVEPARPSETDLVTPPELISEAPPAETPMHTPVLVSPDAPAPPLADPPHSRGRGVHAMLPVHWVRWVLLAIAALGAIGLAYVAYTLFSDNHDSQNDNTEQTTDNAQDARTATGTIAQYTPAQSASQSAHQAAAIKPAVPTSPPKTTSAIPVTPIAPPVAAAPVKPAAPQFRDATQALQAARLAFRANDLSAAQAALGAAQTLQPSSNDAQSLLSELKPLAARRDAALQAAQVCVAQQSWNCARQHANEALAIDTGNDTAKTILERVIRETGWAPLNPHAETGNPLSHRSS